MKDREKDIKQIWFPDRPLFSLFSIPSSNYMHTIDRFDVIKYIFVGQIRIKQCTGHCGYNNE